tara:strand:- start:324 stop:1052 length:729 start_codon:yes stop_codon:yes gene_type:complete
MTKPIEKKLDLSFIVPIYNSAPHIVEKHKELTKIIKGVTKNYEILFCNDASPDNSQELLDEIAGSDNNIRLLVNPNNMGLGYSVKRLINESRGEIIAYTDIDLSFDVSKLGEFMEKIRDYDVVAGSRYIGMKSYVPLHRKIISRCYWLICRILFSVPISDIGTGFFLIKKKCFNDFRFVTTGFAVSIELHAKLHKKGCKFLEIPVAYNHHSGPASTFKLFKHFLPTFYETLLVLYDLKLRKH